MSKSTTIRSTLGLTIWIFVASCGPSQNEGRTFSGNTYEEDTVESFRTNNMANNPVISATDFGEDWPFTVDSGSLSCVRSSVIFTVNGNSYGINGVAKSSSNGYLDVEDIWKYDPEMLEFQRELAESENKTLVEIQREMGGTPRISISKVLDAGLELCD